MKNLYIILLSAFALTSCEEVIDLNLDTAPKKLVIDAALDWKKGEAKAYPIVDISYTEAYFGETHSPAVNNAVVKIVSGTQTYSLTLWDGTSTITSDNLPELKGGSRYVFPAGITPELGKNYELIVELNGQTYTAKDKMLEAPVIPSNRITQKEKGGFLGDRKELRFYFDGINDGVANAYLVKLSQNNTSKTIYGTLDDNYIANNKFFFIMTGVDDDEIDFVFTGFVDKVDKGAFMIVLDVFELVAEVLRHAFQAKFDVFQGVVAVVFGLAAAEQIQVGAVNDKY